MSRRSQDTAGTTARPARALVALVTALGLTAALAAAGPGAAAGASAVTPLAVTPLGAAPSATGPLGAGPLGAAPAAAALPQAFPAADPAAPAVEPDISAVNADVPTASEAAALGAPADSVVASAPVTGFATVGVVWDGPTAPAGVSVEVRTAGTDGVWSDWDPLTVEPGPDDATTGGTEPLVVGDVARAEAKVAGAAAAGLSNVRLTVVDPGSGTVDARAALPGEAPSGQAAPAAPGRSSPPPDRSRPPPP